MPIISTFFGIIIRMFFDEHDPPHLHAEYQDYMADFDFTGNIIRGDLNSRTATKLVRDWIDIHIAELDINWESARVGKEIKNIPPLN